MGYDVGPRDLRLLLRYWDCLIIVTRASGYHGETLKWYRWFTQGYPLSPAIIKVEVNAILCHWMMEIAVEEAGPGGFGREAGQMAKVFYAENGLLASTRMERLQREFIVLTNLLDHMDLRTNVGKTVSMVCQP